MSALAANAKDMTEIDSAVARTAHWHKTRSDKTRPDKTRPDKTRHKIKKS